jgi:[1-hydroxy-2-(trimethylamino)ethyl]phosphonate dioxygenase
MWENPAMAAYQQILRLYEARGSDSYFGESVSTTQHGLQAAYFAHQEEAPPALVLAALLHDIGHLIEAAPNDLAEWSDDARHEEVGASWLAQRFGPEVSEPVRLHVAAKRFLCAIEPGYFARLSAASRITLNLQGGPLSAGEIERFRAQPYHRDAVRVRQWDDCGKVAGLAVPVLSHYEDLINRFVINDD